MLLTSKTHTMKWSEFKSQLSQFPSHHLQFEIAKDTFVHPSFHITEIKQANITSVDCGGKKNEWTEIIVQLWEPEALENNRSMQVTKALSIIDLVEKSVALDYNAAVKIEFGNAVFETKQMLPQEFEIKNDELILKLQTDATQCKAIDRGESCGTPKPKLKITNTSENVCTPDSGCC